jgi:hypothetical protein
MIMKLLVVLALLLAHTLAFAPGAQKRSTSALGLAIMSPPPSIAHVSQLQQPRALASSDQPLKQGVQTYLLMREDIPSLSSTSVTVSLQERKIPTAEEVAAKKRNFNFWFWGGGFVAPFLATFYYFGFKFWEK